MNKSNTVGTVIIGVGNILLGDEGVGIHVIEELKKVDLPPYVIFIDGGTAGFKLFPILETYQKSKFLIIDAIKISDNNLHYDKTQENISKNIPKKGDIYLLPLNDLYNLFKSNYQQQDFLSFHQTGIIDVLKLFYLTYKIKINGYLIGININSIKTNCGNNTFSMKLSKDIENKIQKIIKIIKKNII